MKAMRQAAILSAAILCLSAGKNPDPERAQRDFAERKKAVAERDDEAPAELQYNLSLAALAAGAIEDAEIAAEKAAARGGEPFYSRRDMLLARAAWQRSEQAEAAAEMQNQNPLAYGRAIAHAETALREWRSALRKDPEAAAARRNAERAVVRILELKKKRDLAAAQPPPKKDGAAPPSESGKGGEKKTEPDPESNDETQNRRPRKELPRPEPVEAKGPIALPTELADDQVKRLSEKLTEKEREKKKSRRARVDSGRTDVEKDW